MIDSTELDIEELLSSLITTYDKPGKGRKKCPKCPKYVGARQHECACGHEFTETDKKSVKNVRESDPTIISFLSKTGKSPRERVVDIPSGKPPVKLTDTSQEAVSDWCNRVLWNGRNDGVIYTPNAIKYFIQYHLSIHDPDYSSLKNRVDYWAENYGVA